MKHFGCLAILKNCDVSSQHTHIYVYIYMCVCVCVCVGY